MVVERKLYLEVLPEQIYKQMSDVNFFNKALNTGKSLNVVYQQDRIVSYELEVKGAGKWESQRILIPEKLMFITERRNPLNPFEYMVILNIYEEYKNGTKFIYKEEFRLKEENEENKEKVFKDISVVVERNMNIIGNYYGILRECEK